MEEWDQDLKLRPCSLKIHYQQFVMFVTGSLWWPPGAVCWAAFSARVTDLEPDLITQISLSPTGGTCINQVLSETHSGQKHNEGQLCVHGDPERSQGC